MHFTLARFYVRSKGKCSGCKRLAEYCYTASNLGRLYVRSKGKCCWQKPCGVLLLPRARACAAGV